MHILIIEDDKRLSQNIQKLLEKKYFTSTIAHTAEKGIYFLETESYDAIILDWMLPDKEGIEVCRMVREKNNMTPIIMLTSKSQIEDKVEGLATGADDYLTKPFAAEELLARLDALIRRRSGNAYSAILKVSNLVLNASTQKVTRGGAEILLAPREYALLEYLLIHKNEAVARLDLLHHVWGEQVDPFSNTIDVHIRYLRIKIDEGFEKKIIQTVKSRGYMICDD